MNIINIPHAVKIGYTHYGVNMVEGHNYIYGKNKKRLDGEINYLSEKIRIDTRLTASQQEETFLHECIHGVSKTYGINLTEEQVASLSVGLYTMFLDNPALLNSPCLSCPYSEALEAVVNDISTTKSVADSDS